MKQSIKLGALSIIAASIGFAVPLTASAGGTGYESNLSTVLATPVSVNVKLSDELAFRANNLPKKLSDRGSARSLNDGFSGNGFYGEDSLEELRQDLVEDITKRLQKEGFEVAENAPATLVLTIENVKNNRPTFEQLSREPSLSYQSYGIGGAELSGELLDANGTSLGTMDYRWYDSFIQNANYASGTWTDTQRAFDRFSRKVAKDLVG
tara:strand:- start:890 stop:1516 length:627 start_codon:yes stop_codon:yes gene_type:complete